MADEHTESRIKPQYIVVAVCAVLLLVFALLNTDEVHVDFLFDSVSAPLVVVIVLSALLGFVIGWFVGRRRHDRD